MSFSGMVRMPHLKSGGADRLPVDIFHLEMPTELEASSIKILEGGPLRASVMASIFVGQSVIQVSFYLYLRRSARNSRDLPTGRHFH